MGTQWKDGESVETKKHTSMRCWDSSHTCTCVSHLQDNWESEKRLCYPLLCTLYSHSHTVHTHSTPNQIHVKFCFSDRERRGRERTRVTKNIFSEYLHTKLRQKGEGKVIRGSKLYSSVWCIAEKKDEEEGDEGKRRRWLLMIVRQGSTAGETTVCLSNYDERTKSLISSLHLFSVPPHLFAAWIKWCRNSLSLIPMLFW